MGVWASAARISSHGVRPVAVCLEQSRGPLIYALLKYNFLTLYPVNSRTLVRFREAFSPSRHKDDPADAEHLAELLLHHRERLRAWAPDNEQSRTLRLLVEHRRRLVGYRTRLSNRLTALLRCYHSLILRAESSDPTVTSRVVEGYTCSLLLPTKSQTRLLRFSYVRRTVVRCLGLERVRDLIERKWYATGETE